MGSSRHCSPTQPRPAWGQRYLAEQAIAQDTERSTKCSRNTLAAYVCCIAEEIEVDTSRSRVSVRSVKYGLHGGVRQRQTDE